jgi:cytochrome c oxidase cbb3-type subunit 1
LPLFVLFTGAATWVALASVFDLIASIKFHAPDFLTGCAWLTYGRVHAAAANALLYGFALQAGFGVGLRIFAQRGGARVCQPGLIALGGEIWNLGVLVGVVAILAGDSTGFESLEMPRYAALILSLAYLLIGLWTVLTLRRRREPGLAAPQWFLLAALFWFPWIYSTANLLLLAFPVRGVEQSVIAWWYSNNLTVVWLSLVGLAAIFHLLRKDAGSHARSGGCQTAAVSEADGGRGSERTALTPPLSHAMGEGGAALAGPGEGRLIGNDYRPLFAFWTLIVFGSWVGIPSTAPAPVWMPTLSTIATVLLLVPLLTVAVIVCGTLTPPPSHRMGEGGPALPGPAEGGGLPSSSSSSSSAASYPAVRFVKFGVAAWLIAGAMKIVAVLPGVSPFIQFTWFTAAQSLLNGYGFFAMTMFGAIYCMMPGVAGVDWPLPKVVRAHFWCSAIGVLLLVVPLAIGGVVQGIQLNNAEIVFMDLTKATLPYLRVSTLGNALILLGNSLLIGNLLGLSARYGWAHFVPVYRSMTRGPATMEVPS